MEQQHEHDAEPPANLPKSKFLLSLVALCAVNLAIAFELTAIPLALPTISLALHATSAQVFWIGTSFVVASAAIQPVFATLSDPFGRKPLILIGLVFLIVGSILSAISENVALMLAGRCLQGIGAGGLSALTYAVLVDLFPLQDRTKGISLLSIVRLIGLVAGPIVGGAFAERGAWRWVFWILVPLGGISFVLAAVFLETPHKAEKLLPGLRQVDWVGSLLFVASLSAFLIAISWGGVMFSWASLEALLPLLLGVVGLALCLAYEHFLAKKPMISLKLLSNHTAGLSYLGIFFLGLIQFAILYYLPLYFEISKGYSPIISGVALLPQCICAGLSGAITGQLVPKVGRYKSITIVGWIVLTLGCGVLVLLDQDTSIPSWIFLSFPSAIAIGVLLVSQPIAAQAAASKANMTMAASLTPLFRTIGQAVGIVVGGSVFQNRLEYALDHSKDAIVRSQSSLLATDFVQLNGLLRGQSDQQAISEIRNAFDVSIQTIFWCLLAFAGFSLLTSLCIEEIPLRKRSTAAGAELSKEKAET